MLDNVSLKGKMLGTKGITEGKKKETLQINGDKKLEKTMEAD